MPILFIFGYLKLMVASLWTKLKNACLIVIKEKNMFLQQIWTDLYQNITIQTRGPTHWYGTLILDPTHNGHLIFDILWQELLPIVPNLPSWFLYKCVNTDIFDTALWCFSHIDCQHTIVVTYFYQYTSINTIVRSFVLKFDVIWSIG